MEIQRPEDVIYPTTEEHFKLFQRECLYWIKKLSLVNWEWFFTQATMEDRAIVEFHLIDRIATITLSKTWYNVEPTCKRICRVAYHEVLEVLLGSLEYIAISKIGLGEHGDALYEGEIHKIIRTLENTHFVDDYKNRMK